MAGRFQPLDVAGNYFAGRNHALGEQTQMQQNALAGRRADLQERAFEAEQQSAAQLLNDEQKKQFATVMVQAAQYGLQSPTPKAFIEKNYPQLAELAGPEWQTLDDNGVKAKLQESMGVFGPMAGIGPQQPKGAGALYKIVDPETGEIRYADATEARGETPYVYKPQPSGPKQPQIPRGYRATQNGDLEPIPGGPADPTVKGGSAGGKPPSEGERTAANFYARMKAVENILGTEYVPTTAEYMAAQKVMSGGSVAASAANSFLNEDAQSYYQAASDWVRAKLRKESGAVIGADEMAAEIKTYFPLPGDSKKVIEQKRQARIQATQGMANMGGRATAEYDAQAPSAEPTATGPNGEKIVYRNGQWQPL